MQKTTDTTYEFAVCINNSAYPASLERHKIYRVDIRIIDESGEDYLYNAEWFVGINLPHKAEESLLYDAV